MFNFGRDNNRQEAIYVVKHSLFSFSVWGCQPEFSQWSLLALERTTNNTSICSFGYSMRSSMASILPCWMEGIRHWARKQEHQQTRCRLRNCKVLDEWFQDTYSLEFLLWTPYSPLFKAERRIRNLPTWCFHPDQGECSMVWCLCGWCSFLYADTLELLRIGKYIELTFFNWISVLNSVYQKALLREHTLIFVLSSCYL